MKKAQQKGTQGVKKASAQDMNNDRLLFSFTLLLLYPLFHSLFPLGVSGPLLHMAYMSPFCFVYFEI
jgi:hypothetical protein